MKSSGIMLSLFLGPWLVLGQLGIVPNETIPTVFSGDARIVNVAFRNASDQDIEVTLGTRLLQASSATTMPVGDLKPWKKLRVLAGQTIMETAAFSFPEIKAVTRFIIQWHQENGELLGKTDVLVYPPGLLKALLPLLEETSLGVYDPQNLLKPCLKSVKMEWQDLDQGGWDKFDGNLAILGPFTNREPILGHIADQLQTLAKRKVAVLWLQPPTSTLPKLEPSLYAVPVGSSRVVVVPAGVVANLADKPLSQLNLIRLAEFALYPERMELPKFNP